MAEFAKLKIYSFRKDDLSDQPDVFEVMYNPGKFTRTFTAKYSDGKATGNTKPEKNHRANESDTVSFEFLFDGTAASINKQREIYEVEPNIQEFLKLTYEIDKKIRKPRNLI
ncbi:MAG: hypothetical protein OEW75_19070, partial [Cyclobacteriaceae bacterium]|nr:hypothetical protein [Cyclobacteriaceae bacterium]